MPPFSLEAPGHEVAMNMYDSLALVALRLPA
jgi:hypothetical protein